MRNARKLLTTGLLTLGVLSGGALAAGAPALAAAPEKPLTEKATAVTATTATLNGVLNPLVEAPTPGYYFTYSTNGTCEESTTEAVAEEPAVKVKALKVSTSTLATPVTGLQPNKEYMFCVVATHLEGEETQTSPSTAAPFKTAPAAPKVDSESASGVQSSEATLEAQVNPNNEVTTGYLQYWTSPTVDLNGALEGAIPTVVPPGPEIGSDYADHPVGPAVLAGLTADRKYYYQAVATNATGTTYGPVQGFTTLDAPAATTGEAQNVTRTSATFSGTVTPNGAETSYRFAYISQAGYERALAGTTVDKADPYAEGETIASAGAGASYEPQAVGPVPTASLLPETTYHYALIAKNEVGVTIGPDETLTTLSRTPPTVSTGGVSAVSQNTATLSGTVATNSLQSTYGFEIGTEAGNYGPATGLGSIGGASTETVSLTLGELQPGTTYYYRVTATNADGTSQGAPAAFTTPGFPTLLAAPASPPLVATPQVAFPREEKESATTVKTLTNAQKLAAALKACKKQRGKRKQAKCKKQARGRYGQARSKRKK
jgi:hypothetical protein